MNVKKTKSSKKIVLKITMSMTIGYPNFVNSSLDVNTYSVKPGFLDEEYVCIVTACHEHSI